MISKKVSIIVPVFNGEKYINSLIQSILNQTYYNYELLIVNDGSTDNTKKILKKYINNKKIKVFNNSNNGVSYSRNYGVNKATGEYILFVDADDYLEINALEVLMNLVNETNVDIIRFNGFIQQKNGKYARIPMPIDDNTIIKSKYDKEKIIELINDPNKSIRCYTPLLFIKNQNIIKFNSSLRYLEDKVFYLENFLNGDKTILFTQKQLYFYNYNNCSKTKNVDYFKKNIEDIILASNAIKDIVKDYNLNVKKMCDSSTVVLIIYRMKYLSNNTSFSDFKSIVNEVFSNNEIIRLFSKDYNNINKKNSILLKLVKNKKWKRFYLINRICSLIKKSN